MSHKATNWAIQQRGLKPATKLLLWFLADCHNPALGCFPSQEYLAENAEMSRSTVNLHLQKLEEMKLIERVQNWDNKNKKQLPTSYILALENTKAVSENRTRDELKAESEKQAKPSPKNEQSRVRNSDTNLVSKPVKEPLSSAQAPSNEEREVDLVVFEKITKVEKRNLLEAWGYFGKFNGNEKNIFKAFEKLSAPDRLICLEHIRIDAYKAAQKASGRTYATAFSTYLQSGTFDAEQVETALGRLRVEAAARDKADNAIQLKQFGSAWFAHRLWQLKFGKRGVWKPRAGFQKTQFAKTPEMFDGDVESAKWRCLSDFPTRLMDEKQLAGNWQSFVQVAVGSAGWDAWNAWHETNGYPPLEPRRGYEWLWVPVPDPTGMTLDELTRSKNEVAA